MKDTFKTALTALQAANKKISQMEKGECIAISKTTVNSLASLVEEAVALVNRFALSMPYDETDDGDLVITVDRESVIEEIAMMQENCEAINGRAA